MIKVKRIDHVAIATGDRDLAVQNLSSLFGLCAGPSERVAGQQTDVSFLLMPDAAEIAHDNPETAGLSGGLPARLPSCEAALEIISPAGPTGNPALARFLDRRGPGLHHICFEVDDLPAALASLKTAGVRLIDETPRPGARGHLVAFIHPAATGGVLFELCATPNGAQA